MDNNFVFPNVAVIRLMSFLKINSTSSSNKNGIAETIIEEKRAINILGRKIISPETTTFVRIVPVSVQAKAIDTEHNIDAIKIFKAIIYNSKILIAMCAEYIAKNIFIIIVGIIITISNHDEIAAKMLVKRDPLLCGILW